MKKLLLLASLFMSFAAANAQTPKPAEPATALYTIQLGAFEESVKQADFEAIRSYAYVYKRDGLIFIGGFPTAEAAEPILEKVKDKGFDEAFVVARTFKKAKSGYTIQIATRNASESMNWTIYAQAGDLYTLPSGVQVRISHGFFEDKNEANVKLKDIQSLGFADAFVKSVKDVQLTPVSVFETNDKALVVKSPEIGPKVAAKSPPKAPTSYNPLRRKSVLKLQEALKELNVYSSLPDGAFNKTTQLAFDRAIQENRRLIEYGVAAEKYGDFGEWSAARLMMTISRDLNISDQPQAIVADLLNNLPEDPLSKKEADAALAWHAATWKKMETWSNGAQYNDQIYTALKVTYYRTLAQLEDKYFVKGFKGEEATALAVSVLRALVSGDLDNF